MAIALEEELGYEALASRVVFLEREPTTRWHPGLMLPGSTLQVSFLKDLVTLRDPTSPYTFLNYLSAAGRLDHFANLRTFYPSRAEFADYISWVAERFAPLVRYDTPVRNVVPVRDPSTGPVNALRVETGDGDALECRTLVAASGGVPSIPSAFRPALGPRAFHASEYLLRIPPPEELRGASVAVVGSGQSAGEVVHHLLSTVPEVRVVAVIRDFALRPMDDSKFINEVFFPETIDFTYDLPKKRRDTFLRSVRQSNYSAVDADLIDDLYRLLYEARVAGRTPLRFLNQAFIIDAEHTEEKVAFRVRNQLTSEIEEVDVDYAVLATGYRSRHFPAYLERLHRFFHQREGLPEIGRDYRLRPTDDIEANVYVQGFAEHTHGISDTLLSIAAHRAGVIAPQLAARIRRSSTPSPAVSAAAAAAADGDRVGPQRAGDEGTRDARARR